MIIAHTVVDTACERAPMTKRHDASRRTGRRPSRSAIEPVIGEARSAKSDVEEVMRDLDSVDRGAPDRSLCTEIRVEEMTPVLGIVSEVVPLYQQYLLIAKQ
jgi:hypothetical protein